MWTGLDCLLISSIAWAGVDVVILSIADERAVAVVKKGFGPSAGFTVMP